MMSDFADIRAWFLLSAARADHAFRRAARASMRVTALAPEVIVLLPAAKSRDKNESSSFKHRSSSAPPVHTRRSVARYQCIPTSVVRSYSHLNPCSFLRISSCFCLSCCLLTTVSQQRPRHAQRRRAGNSRIRAIFRLCKRNLSAARVHRPERQL